MYFLVYFFFPVNSFIVLNACLSVCLTGYTDWWKIKMNWVLATICSCCCCLCMRSVQSWVDWSWYCRYEGSISVSRPGCQTAGSLARIPALVASYALISRRQTNLSTCRHNMNVTQQLPYPKMYARCFVAVGESGASARPPGCRQTPRYR